MNRESSYSRFIYEFKRLRIQQEVVTRIETIPEESEGRLFASEYAKGFVVSIYKEIRAR